MGSNFRPIRKTLICRVCRQSRAEEAEPMSPALAKTSDDEIIAAARAIIAEHGVDKLSLGEVATAVGIKAPSLYKRFADRGALVDAVRDSVLRQLADALEAA